MAQRIITAKGQAVIWRSMIEANASDPSEPYNISTPSPVDHDTSIVFFPMGLQSKRYIQSISKTLVPESYYYGLMPYVSGLEPKIKDIVIRGNEKLNVHWIDILEPNGEQILYTIGFTL